MPVCSTRDVSFWSFLSHLGSQIAAFAHSRIVKRLLGPRSLGSFPCIELFLTLPSFPLPQPRSPPALPKEALFSLHLLELSLKRWIRLQGKRPFIWQNWPSRLSDTTVSASDSSLYMRISIDSRLRASVRVCGFCCMTSFGSASQNFCTSDRTCKVAMPVFLAILRVNNVVF